jgi:aminoglycoside phosphotransferase (APT) family kinase protein
MSAMRPPGKLLATGRDCDIFEYGPGLVLRRSRHGRSMALEARTMDYVRHHGYPVPSVHEISADGTCMVLERVDGVTMVDAIRRRPWNISRYGSMLAELHIRLHEIPAPDFLASAPMGSGDMVVHLDLHPLNVMIGTNGPVVIDWPNARRGDPVSDVCLAWVLMESGEVPGGMVGKVLGLFRSLLVNGFLSRFDREKLRASLREVVAWKVQDPNMSPAEQRHMWRLVESAEALRP